MSADVDDTEPEPNRDTPFLREVLERLKEQEIGYHTVEGVVLFPRVCKNCKATIASLGRQHPSYWRQNEMEVTKVRFLEFVNVATRKVEFPLCWKCATLAETIQNGGSHAQGQPDSEGRT